MLILLTSAADSGALKKVGQDLDGYVKFVVDVSQKVMAAGGLRHFEGEQLLLSSGSRQEDLWGGGWDSQTGEIDFESMINIRPSQNNPSREVLDAALRDRIRQIVTRFLKTDV